MSRTPRDTAHLLLNLTFCQVGRFVCVLGAAHGLGSTGAAVGLGLPLALTDRRDGSIARPREAGG